MWPPPKRPQPSSALEVEVPIAPELDRWTSTDLTISAVKEAVCCGDAVVLLLDGCTGFIQQSPLALWRPPAAGTEAVASAPRPLLLAAFPDAPGRPTALWPGDSCFFAQCGSDVWQVELEDPATSDETGDGPLRASAARVFSADGCGAISSMHCSVAAGGGLHCAMIKTPPTPAVAGPIIVRPGQSMHQDPAATLCVWEPRTGLRAVADVPRLSEQLVVSRGARKVCVWRTMLNDVPEEAERGEFLGLSLDRGASVAGGKLQPICLTEGAGRVGWAAVSDDGQLVLLQANFSATHPVTVHMALVLIRWPRGEPPRPERQMLVEGQHVLSFHFLPDSAHGEGTFVATSLRGVDAETSLWKCSAAGSGGDAVAEDSRFAAGGCGADLVAQLPKPILSTSATYVPIAERASGDGPAGFLVFGSEGPDALPFVAAVPLTVGGMAPVGLELSVELPQPDGAGLLRAEKVVYPHGDNQVTALLFERTEPPLPADAPLLVHVHGGPAIGVLHSQRMAADATRYPYRQFLVAGYRVFMPLFRGTLGFGDRWSQGNIGSQGSLKGDLGDILAGVKWLNSDHPRLRGTVEPSRTGIWGGSYGGYMTMRAMSEVPERFGAGVALYGFVHNRWMTYEGGDFTWEDEYIVPPDDEFQIQMVELDDERPTAARKEEPASPCSDASPTQEAKDNSGRSRAASNSSQVSASDVWPLPRSMEASDTFNGLHRIARPMLLMHGEKDDICPLSQSQVAFHMLEKRGVPTGLIVYPGEGHGFDDPAHRRDRDRRMLAWWSEHLQGCRGEVPEAFHAKL